jgi:two-component system, chemotaxis family, CheB/CheR fusion protein
VALRPRAKATPIAISNVFPVVGIGASAGGLEAFTQFLQALRPNTGMAFVLVQHLEPTHESILPRLLAKATKMPVEEIREGMRVEPNHVYVIPINADIALTDGKFRVVIRSVSGHYMPVDSFFESLAETKLSRAIGVVMSGTASDGTAGLKAIKLHGGVTFVQEPSSAKFDGMPRSAISAGCVDFVLPPGRIATEIARLALSPTPQADLLEIPPPKEEDWAHLFRLLRTSSGVDFSNYKKASIRRRIARRMALHKFEEFGEYLKFLEGNRAELDLLFHEVLIHVTGFFRDPEVFVTLKETVFPKILAGRPAREPIRIWVPGCSSGEEAYSIAICLLEYLGDDVSSVPIQIFATDINDIYLEKARAGIYSLQALEDVSPERRRRFFSPSNNNYSVNPSVRELCVFARHDLIKDPPFSKLDLVSCRNVLIYFEPVLQKKVLAALHYSLKGTGILLLGRSESLGAFSQLFSPADRKNKFFTRNIRAGEPVEIVESKFEAPPRQAKPKSEAPIRVDLEREADRIVWQRYAHAGIVVDNDLQILHFRGDTASYLQPAPGRATLNLNKMLPQELQLELRTALQEVRRSGRNVRREGIHIKHDEQMRTVNLEVVPLPGSGEGGKCFLILFEEDIASRAHLPSKPPAAEPKAKGARVQELRKVQSELLRTREYLQAVIREQESTNEELKTANEEALSSMEELQSTNEELETAKEELQSSNEELVTLNEQLQNRNAELSLISDDLSNVIGGTNIPILILDQDHRIRRFTPPTQKLLGLSAADVGRPIGNLRIGVNLPDLGDLLSSIAEHDGEIVREVQSEDGHWYLMRMLPFRTSQQKIEGVVIAFSDIHDMKRHQEALQRQETLVSAILNSATELLVMVLDHEGNIAQFNRVCQQLSGYSLEEVRGRKPWEFLVPPDELSKLKETFEQVLRGRPSQTETHWCAKDGRRMLIGWSNTGVTVNGIVESVIATGTDRTEGTKTRQRAIESEATVRALLETAAQAIIAVNPEGKILLLNAATEKMFGYSHDEIIGQEVGVLLPERFRQRHTEHVAKWFSQPIPRRMGAGLDLAGLREDGTEFPVEISLSYIGTAQGIVGVAFVSDITERKKNEEALLDYQKQLQNLTGNLLSVQESGNRALARELHDVFSQDLAGLNLEVADLRASVKKPAVITERLKKLGKKIARLADEMHRTSRQLHPAIVHELGLEAALREECDRFSKQFAVLIGFTSKDVPAPLPDEVSLCLYRVVQESLRNIGKHAKATEVNLQLRGLPGGIGLRIEDNGDGFDVEEARKGGGLGLISMEERVRLVNGKFDIQSQPGVGTIVEVFVPLK